MSQSPASPYKLSAHIEDAADEEVRLERSNQLLVWARKCAERAAVFREENRAPLAVLQMKRAAQHLRFALVQCPTNLSARFFLIGCLMTIGHFGAAKEQALKALTEITDERKARLQEPILHHALGHIALKLGQNEDAIAYFQAASSDFPDYPRPSAALARVLSRAGRYVSGTKMARLALERDMTAKCPALLTEGGRQAVLRCLFQCLAAQGASEIREEDLEKLLQDIDCSSGSSSDTDFPRVYFHSEAKEDREGPATPRPGAPDPAIPREEAPGRVPSPKYSRLHKVSSLAYASCLEDAETPRASPVRAPREEDNLGMHVVLQANLAVKVDASCRSSTAARLSANTLVNVVQVVFDDEEEWVWGYISIPCGWISLLNTKTGHRWAVKQADAPDTQQCATPRVRSLPFGPPDEAGTQLNSSTLRAAAMNDLNQIFAGLMPSSSGAGEGARDPGSIDVTIMQPVTSRLTTCCSCRKACDDE